MLCLKRRLLRRLARRDEGNAVVEFGLVAPVILALVVSAYDYGSAYVENLRLVGAARAGAQEAMFEPTDWQNTSRLEQAALEDHAGHSLSAAQIASYPVAASASAFCACADGTVVTCSSTCSGTFPQRLVRVTLSRDQNVIMPYPWATSGTLDLQQAATVRIR